MISWILFAITTIILGVIVFFAVRMAYRNGHIGDLTMPVSGVLLLIIGILWVASLGLLISLKSDPLMSLELGTIIDTYLAYV